MALQTSMNRRNSWCSSSELAGLGLERLVVVKSRDRLLERVTSDEPHRVVRPALGIGAQAVDGNDAGVLEPAGDLGLGDEPSPADGVGSVLPKNLLECDLAVQLAVERDEDGPQAALSMRPQHAKPLPFGSGRADGICDGAVGVIALDRRALRRADVPECCLEVRAAGAQQTLTGGAFDGQNRKALGCVTAGDLDMKAGDGLDDLAARGIEVAEVDEMVAQRPALVPSPGGEGRKQRPLVDQAVLQCKQTDEKIAIGVDGGHDVDSNARVPPTRVGTHDGALPRATDRIGPIIAWPLV